MEKRRSQFLAARVDTTMEIPLKNENGSEIPLATDAAPSESSEGGPEAWCTVVGGWLALFATFGYASSFGVYQDFYTRIGTSSSSNISWIGSTQLFFLIATGLPAGRLLDKGYFRPVVLTGSFIYVFSLFMLSLAHLDRYYQIFLSQGVGMGIGAGLIYVPSMAIQAHHWRARRALAMGVVISGSSFGGIIYPIMLNNLFHDSTGFTWGVRASAFLTLGLLVIANCLMSPKFLSLNASRQASDSSKAGPREILRDSAYMLMVAGAFLIIWGLFFPYFYLQLFAVLHGLPVNFAFYTLTIQNAASVFGRTLPNLFADKMGVLNALIIMTLGTGVLVFALFGITNVGGVAIFAILYGFFSGGVLALFSPVLASFSRDVSEIGLRMGIGFFVSSLSWLTGPPIAGVLLNNGTHWIKPIIFSGTIMLAGVPLLFASRSVQAIRKKSQYV